MKLLSILLVLIFLLFGFLCVFAACDAMWELATTPVVLTGEAILNWCIALITLVIGMICFACCPLVLDM